MSRQLVLLTLLLFSSACQDGMGIQIDVATRVAPLDQLTFSVYTPDGAVLLDVPLPATGVPSLPGRVRLDAPRRSTHLRVFAWGWHNGSRVAFGAVGLDVPTKSSASLTLDIPPPDEDGDGIPDSFDDCPTVADPTQADSNADGGTNACPVGDGGTPLCPGNIATNAGFEDGTEGWAAFSAVFSRVAGGHESGFAAQACKNAGATYYNINDNPPLVQSPVQGARYQLDAWIRANDSLAQDIHPTIREYDSSGGSVASSNAGTVAPGLDWQKISTTFQVTHSGSATVQIDVTALDAADGACFLLDDVCFVALP